VIEGGQSMNPSTADIVAAIQATPATEVLVLPNNSNVILSAEQAAKLVDKQVRVLPSRSVPAGLSAILRYLPSLSAEENEAAMLEALEQVATGEVTVASRDVQLDGVDVRKGAWLGLADGAAVASSADFDDVASAVADRLLGNGREVLTLLTGEDEPDLGNLLRRIQERHPAVELDVQPGGQPHYPLLLSAE
jgi:dihydroxyacetone kinase-like predicted kinase